MASLPSPTQVAGNHYAIYEAYYNQIDPNNQGKIRALDAARFLKKSKLSDVVLSKIWDLSDPTGKGHLNKQGFFVALKLCALAQDGRGISMDNITSDAPQPKMGDIPKATQNKLTNSAPPGTIDWSVNPAEKAKYDQLFDSLQPMNGVIPGNKVRGVLMESKLPFDLLGKIWDLADLDKDGSLSRHEFMIAMHLVYKALEKHTIPNTLPAELLPSGKRKDSSSLPASNLIMPPSKPPIPPLPVAAVTPPHPGRPPLPQQHHQPPPPHPPPPVVPPPSYVPPSYVAKQPTTTATGHVNSHQSGVHWVVSAEAKAQADLLFAKTDADKDGFVSGFEIKDVFLQSGVQQAVLAHIWSLCDSKQTGKLNNEEFALAMWLINQKVNGVEPPGALTPEMVPPSLRTRTEQEPPQPALYSNPELDLIASEISELTKEKNTLETDIAQKEADIKIKSGEVKSLQSELDTLAATLKQLENQKGEANKRLNDLKTQVDKLRYQAEEQEQSLKSQEDELSNKKQELEGLKQEEARLEALQEENRRILDNLAKKLQDSSLQISQVKAKVSELEETQRQMNDAISVCDQAIENNDASLVPDTSLSIGPDFRDPQITKLTIITTTNNNNMETLPNNKDDNTFSNMNGNSVQDDFFQNDAFRSTISPGLDAFASSDPFASAFGAPAKPPTDGFSDAFGSYGAQVKADPFDPFGDGSNKPGAKTPAEVAAEKDPFGCDPFAALHAPERPTSNPPARPESPSPALPPKKAKQPPPRPAPPRPLQPNRAAPVPPTPSPDPTSFGNSSDAFSSGFADFADFDTKLNSARGVGTRSPVKMKKPSENRYSTFEFTEDPFKNYRYEDVFDVADPFDKQAATRSGKVDAFGLETDDLAYETPVGGGANNVDLFEAKFPAADAFSPDFSSLDTTPAEFQKHPFGSSDFVNNNNNNSFSKIKVNGDDNKLDNFFGDSDNNWFNSNSVDRTVKSKKKKDLPSEDQQLAWAAKESLRLEEERRKRQEQEKADLEYALEISKKDTLPKDKKKIRNLLSLGKSKTPNF